MKKVLFFLMLIVTSIASWAQEPCTHENLGADDICLSCGQIQPHKSRLPMVWTLGGVTATYNPIEKSLEFSGSGEIPACEHFYDVDEVKEFYPWYAALNMIEVRIDEHSTIFKCDPLNKIIIGEGVTYDNSNYNVCTNSLSASVVIDHSTKSASDNEWYFSNKDVLVLENDEAKTAYHYNPMYYFVGLVFTQAELTEQGISSFPAAGIREDCRHNLIREIFPVCSWGVDNVQYCYACGLTMAPATDGYGYYDLTDKIGNHNYGGAHTCTNWIYPNPACGKKDPAYCSHSNITEYAAVATSQQNPGHIAFVKCSDCDAYFAADDASHTTALDFETQVLIAQLDPTCTHEHYTNGVCANCGYACAHPGSVEMTPKCTGVYTTYFRCDVCGLAFADAACKTQISEFDLSHKFPTSGYSWDRECEHGCGMEDPEKCGHYSGYRVLHEGVEATCTTDGNLEYYECSKCGLFFDGKYSDTKLADVVIPATGHAFNSYDVCSNCGLEGPEAIDCDMDHYFKTVVGDNRTSCIMGLGPEHETYYRCNVCDRYLKWYDGEMTVIIKSDMDITPAPELHNGHLVYHNAGPATCTEFGHRYSYKECTDCNRRYHGYTPDDECVIHEGYNGGIDKGYFTNTIMNGEPLGHNVDPLTHKCTRCGFAPTYRKVMANSQIKRDAYYIIVSRIDGQYYALGKPKDAEFRSFLEGYDAVPVDVNPDGTITVTDPKVAQLYTLGNPGYTFYNNTYGLIGLEPGHMADLTSFIKFDKEQSVPVCYGDWDCNVMKLSIANDNGVVWTKDGELVDVQYRHTTIEPGSMIWAFAGAGITGSFNPARMKIYREVFLGEKEGENTFVFNGANSVSTHIKSVDENGFDNYYPAFLYVLDTQVLINTEAPAACISGPATSDDVDDFIIRSSSKQYASIDLRFARGISKTDVEKIKSSPCITNSTVILLPDDFDVDGIARTNLVVGDVCQDMEIEDKKDVDIPAMFNAARISYSRAMTGTSQWGTLCMPFAVESNDDVQLYELSEVNNEDGNGVLRFTAIDSAAPGQPVVFRKNDKDADGITIVMENAELKSGESEPVSTGVDKWVIRGTLKATTIQSGTEVTEYDEIHETVVSSKDVNRYYIASDKFWNAKKEAIVPAFRAWFEADAPTGDPASVKSAYTIFIMGEDDNVTAVLNSAADGELEECTEIYDLNGRKLEKVVKGQVNIINGQKIFVK